VLLHDVEVEQQVVLVELEEVESVLVAGADTLRGVGDVERRELSLDERRLRVPRTVHVVRPHRHDEPRLGLQDVLHQQRQRVLELVARQHPTTARLWHRQPHAHTFSHDEFHPRTEHEHKHEQRARMSLAHTNTQRHRHTNTQTHRHTETQRHRDTKTQTHLVSVGR
jgi:hypothetical protein